jgi:lipopolysaccharide transport system permease protein
MKNKNQNNNEWDLIINNKKSIFKLNLKGIVKHKDLLFLFVYRDFVSTYKQTILGPLWFFIQPILTSITFIIIFGGFAKIPSDGIPGILFYMSGIIMWNYFADCINQTSHTFTQNQNLFGKVYFPRIIVPLSKVVNNLLKFFIQLILFLILYAFFYLNGFGFSLGWTFILLPLLLIQMAFTGLGFGMIVSSLTTKYKDLTFLINFAVQLLMYASPIVYPISIVPEKYKWIIMLNPFTSIIEIFKNSVFGTGYINIYWILYSFCFSIIVFLIGLIIFNKVEKSFIDTI